MKLADTIRLLAGGPGSGRKPGGSSKVFVREGNQAKWATISLADFHRGLAKLDAKYPTKPGEFPPEEYYTEKDKLKHLAGLDW